MLTPDGQEHALSLLQPWATLVVLGIKTVETRSWRTAYRGPLLIHASRNRAARDFAQLSQISRYIPDFLALPFGAVIGRVWLDDIVPYDPLTACWTGYDSTLELGAFGEQKGMRWAFLLCDAVQFEQPVPARGKQGIFRI